MAINYFGASTNQILPAYSPLSKKTDTTKESFRRIVFLLSLLGIGGKPLNTAAESFIFLDHAFGVMAPFDWSGLRSTLYFCTARALFGTEQLTCANSNEADGLVMILNYRTVTTNAVSYERDEQPGRKEWVPFSSSQVDSLSQLIRR